MTICVVITCLVIKERPFVRPPAMVVKKVRLPMAFAGPRVAVGAKMCRPLLMALLDLVSRLVQRCADTPPPCWFTRCRRAAPCAESVSGHLGRHSQHAVDHVAPLPDTVHFLARLVPFPALLHELDGAGRGLFGALSAVGGG